MVSSRVRPARRPGVARTRIAAAARRLAPGAATTWWREFLLVGMLYGAYELSRGIGDVDVGPALANGREILHLEQVWHLDPERLLNGALHHVVFLAVLASYFYSLMHYLITPVVLVWMYRSHREHYGRARTALAISTLIGLVGYLLLPTAPPRLIPHSGLRDTLSDTQHWGWWSGNGSVPKGLGGLTNQFAAMPSLHVGWAAWCGVLVALHARRRWVRALGVAYPLLTTLVVLATGNHYLLDAVAGVATVAAGALLSARLAPAPTVVTMRADGEGFDDVLLGSAAPPAGSPVRIGPVVVRDDELPHVARGGLCRQRL